MNGQQKQFLRSVVETIYSIIQKVDKVILTRGKV